MNTEFYYFNPRLTERLNRIRRLPFTIVSARKGSGKSTAVKAYLSNIEGRIAWHAISDAPYEAWLGNALSLLTPEIEGFRKQDTELLYKKILAAADPADSLSVLFKQHCFNIRTFYVLEMCGETNEKILRFLYRLALQEIRNLTLIVLTSDLNPCGFRKDTDSRVNFISETAFLYDQEDIRISFSKNGIPVSAEDAAMFFYVTGGWAPLVQDLFHEIGRLEKIRAWKALPYRLAIWEEKVGTAKELGYSEDLTDLLVLMSPAEAFSLTDAERIWKTAGKPFRNGRNRDLYTILFPGKLPSFLRYDEGSGLYRLHFLLRTQFERAFWQLPLRDRERILAAHEELRSREEANLCALEKMSRLLFAMDCEALTKELKAPAVVPESCADETICRILVLKAWNKALCGQAQSALLELESEFRARFAAGKYKEGAFLILSTILLKLFLGNGFFTGTELFTGWTPQIACDTAAEYGDLIFLIIVMNLWRRRELPQHEGFLESYAPKSRYMQVLCRIIFAIARSSNGQTVKAQQDIAAALEYACSDKIILPFACFYEQVFTLFPEKSGKPEKEFLEEVRRKVNGYYRNMRRNSMLAESPGTEALTRRQTEAAELAAQGLTNKGIALRMRVSENTVKTMMKEVFRKLKIEKRTDLKDFRQKPQDHP